MIEQFQPRPDESTVEEQPLNEEILIIKALTNMVQSKEITEDYKQEILNKIISRRLANAEWDMLFFPTH